jgi:CheY-like chemotaxis protein/nitrogen-specific signal transduction histidine kinase
MFIAFLRDITLRTRLERETMEQARELADLHRRKDEFLAMLSHELRNPLAPISNAVHLLRLQPDERPHQREARTIIERQVGQLTRLVDDLLEVSRITTGRIRLDQQPVAVSGVVERSVETVRSLLEQRGHQLTVSLPDQPIWLHADPARLDQVVVNLLTNAAKYTDPGGRIWLTVAREGDEAVLRVRDTGVGIDPELLPRIFDLFTQAENSLDRSQGGLGIGLCLVQRLVEMHGGSVHADSTVGQGSEFVIRLPIAQPAPQAPSPGAPTSQAAPRSLRVLVVDDNVDLARSLASLLKASGHDVRTAHDGPRALEAAREFRPNAVLLDIGLPGMNGFEVAQRMRQEPILQNVVLVAMTGYGQETDRQRSQAAGFDHHLLKPADFALVQQVLATVRESPA